MKWLTRLVCLVMSCLLIVNVSLAELADEDYTQEEKFLQQLSLGSGLRGAMKFAVAGESGLAQLLLPLNDAEFQLRSIRSGDEFSCELYAEKNGVESAQTEIYRDKQNWYLKTELLLGSTLSLPNNGDLLSSVTSSETSGNPSMYSFILRFLSAQPAIWDETIASTSVLSWFEAYAQEPRVISENNENVMRFQYVIPASALLSGMKTTMHDLLADTIFQAKLKSLLTKDQADLVLNPDLMWYFDQVIDKLPLTGNAVFERTVTMQGTEVSSHIVLPVYEPKNVVNQFEILVEEGKTSYILSGPDMDVIWIPESETAGKIQFMRSEQDSAAVRYHFSSDISTTVDADDFHHQTMNYSLKLEEDDTTDLTGEWISFDPIEIQMRLHYYSKSAKRSATTLDVTLAGLIPGGRIQAAAKFRTTTPWEFTHMDTSGSISLESKSSEERIEILQDIFANLLMSLSKEETVVEEVHEEEASPESQVSTEGEVADTADTDADEEIPETENSLTPEEPASEPQEETVEPAEVTESDERSVESAEPVQETQQPQTTTVSEIPMPSPEKEIEEVEPSVTDETSNESGTVDDE